MRLDAVRAKKPQRLPTVMTRAETRRVIAGLSGVHQLIGKLLYGSGLRLMECLRLRVKDVDFAQHHLVVRQGKGKKDRLTVLPESLVAPLQTHLKRVKMVHDQDLARGYGSVYLPNALERKYPAANREWGWHACVFFRLKTYQAIPGRGSAAGTILVRAACSARSNAQPGWPGSTNSSPATPSVTVSLPICSKMVMTRFAELSRSCWAIKTSRRP
jgi:hypothetical protein